MTKKRTSELSKAGRPRMSDDGQPRAVQVLLPPRLDAAIWDAMHARKLASFAETVRALLREATGTK